MTPETNPGEYFVSPVCVAFSSLPSAMFLMDNTVAQKNHVQRCDNHLGDQLIQRLRKKKNWSELRWCCFHSSVCLDTEHNISSDIYQIMLLSAIFKIAAVSPVNLYLPTTKKE